MNKKRNFFLCEGETEQGLLQALSVLGKVIKFNMFEHDINKLIRKLNGDVYVIYDVDIANNNNIQRFIKNIKILKRNTRLIGFLQQTNNLEDELVRATNIKNIQTLQKHFNVAGKNELKNCFIKTNNLFEKLQQIKFNPNLMWQQPTIQILQQSKISRISYQELPKRAKV